LKTQKKSMIALLMIPTHLFVGYQVWFKGIHLGSCFLLATNNLGCAQSMCVFIYRNHLITFVVFYKPFFNKRTTFDQKNFICLFILVNNACQEL
jgi:hypothetical protein